MKKSFLFIFLMLLMGSCSQKNNDAINWIPFLWDSAEISGRHFDKASMSIPVSIENIPYKFTMQFDLGAGFPILYGQSLKPFLDKYSTINKKLDTTIDNGQKLPMLRNINLKLGNVTFKDIDAVIFEDMGKSYNTDSIDLKHTYHIGTFGTYLLKNKTLIIDYPKERLAILDTLPTKYKKATFVKFKTDWKGRVKIPLKINGQKEFLLFDTGASLFSLSTTKQNALKVSDKKIIDSITVSSWGKYVTHYGLKIKNPVYIGNLKLNNSIVYYPKEELFAKFYKSENIWGITGNAYFFNKIVVIDFKHYRFGIVGKNNSQE